MMNVSAKPVSTLLGKLRRGTLRIGVVVMVSGLLQNSATGQSSDVRSAGADSNGNVSINSPARFDRADGIEVEEAAPPLYGLLMNYLAELEQVRNHNYSQYGADDPSVAAMQQRIDLVYSHISQIWPNPDGRAVRIYPEGYSPNPDQFDGRIAALQQQAKDAQSEATALAQKSDADRGEIQNLLSRAFDLRRQSLLLECEQLRQRADRVETSVNSRFQRADQLVARQVNRLLKTPNNSAPTASSKDINNDPLAVPKRTPVAAKVDGRWKLTSVEISGKPKGPFRKLTAQDWTSRTLVVSGNAWIIESTDAEPITLYARTNRSVTPWRLEWNWTERTTDPQLFNTNFEFGSRVCFGIVSVTSDTLKVAMKDGQTAPPASFHETDSTVWAFQRLASAHPEPTWNDRRTDANSAAKTPNAKAILNATISMPSTVTVGEQFEATVAVTNRSTVTCNDIRMSLDVPRELSIVATNPRARTGSTSDEPVQRLEFDSIDKLASAEQRTFTVRLHSKEVVRYGVVAAHFHSKEDRRPTYVRQFFSSEAEQRAPSPLMGVWLPATGEGYHDRNTVMKHMVVEEKQWQYHYHDRGMTSLTYDLDTSAVPWTVKVTGPHGTTHWLVELKGDVLRFGLGTDEIPKSWDEAINISTFVRAKDAPGADKSATTDVVYHVGNLVSEALFHKPADGRSGPTDAEKSAEVRQALDDVVSLIQTASDPAPRFVNVVPGSLSVIVRNSETGHRKVRDVLSKIGANSDAKIRLSIVPLYDDDGETSDAVEDVLEGMLGKPVLTRSQVDAVRKMISKSELRQKAALPDRILLPGKPETITLAWRAVTALARVVPGTKRIQVRLEQTNTSNGKVTPVVTMETINEGEGMVLFPANISDVIWLVTASPLNVNKSTVPSFVKPPTADTSVLYGRWHLDSMGQGNYDEKQGRRHARGIPLTVEISEGTISFLYLNGKSPDTFEFQCDTSKQPWRLRYGGDNTPPVEYIVDATNGWLRLGQLPGDEEQRNVPIDFGDSNVVTMKFRSAPRFVEEPDAHVANLTMKALQQTVAADYLTAIASWDAIILRERLYVEAYFQRGTCFMELGRFDEAGLDFLKCTELNPGYAPAFHGYAKLLLRESNSKEVAEEAVSYAERANNLTRQENWKYLKTLAEAHYDADDNVEAGQCIKNAIALAPEKENAALQTLFKKYCPFGLTESPSANDAQPAAEDTATNRPAAVRDVFREETPESAAKDSE